MFGIPASHRNTNFPTVPITASVFDLAPEQSIGRWREWSRRNCVKGRSLSLVN